MIVLSDTRENLSNKDLSLLLCGDYLYSAWIAFDRFQNRLYWNALPISFLTDQRLYDWKTYAVEEVSETKRVSTAKIPAAPQLEDFGGSPGLLWVDYAGGSGSIYFQDLADGASGEAQVVFDPGEGTSCRSLSVCNGACPRSTPWIAVEIWNSKKVSVVLLCRSAGRWEVIRSLTDQDSFRPHLAPGGDNILLAWNELDRGRYRVVTAELNGDTAKMSDRRCVESEDRDAVFPCIACAKNGSRFLSCTIEQPVLLDNGCVEYRSDIAVFQSDNSRGEWVSIGKESIDYGLNPWQAAYVGRRRAPLLRADGNGGMWLLWEMKQDRRSMNPHLGRLMGKKLAGENGKAMCLIEGRCGFVPAQACSGSLKLTVASRSQFVKGDYRVPFVLHRVDLRESFPVIDHPPTPSAKIFFGSSDPPRGANGEWRLFFGDPHCHSRLSVDLEGELDELYYFAREKAKIDFVAFAENDYMYLTVPMSTDVRFVAVESCERYYDPHRFSTFHAFEYTKHTDPDSHRIVLFADSPGPIYSWFDDTPTVAGLVENYRVLPERSVLLHPHHEYSLDLVDHNLERNIEICSGWGNHMIHDDYVAAVHSLLSTGFEIGFIGGSDNHERTPGLGGALTGVWARSNTRADLFEALWNHRTFATTGSRCILQVWVCDERGKAFIGETLSAHGKLSVQVAVHSEPDIKEIEIIRNLSLIHI